GNRRSRLAHYDQPKRRSLPTVTAICSSQSAKSYEHFGLRIRRRRLDNDGGSPLDQSFNLGGGVVTRRNNVVRSDRNESRAFQRGKHLVTVRGKQVGWQSKETQPAAGIERHL